MALHAIDVPSFKLRETPAQVNTEVVDALATDTYAEPAQGAPAATARAQFPICYTRKTRQAPPSAG